MNRPLHHCTLLLLTSYWLASSCAHGQAPSRENVLAKLAPYQAMFDEATTIFKCTNSPPSGRSQFLDYEGLPSDHYLWLTGKGGQLIRKELSLSEAIPIRTKQNG